MSTADTIIVFGSILIGCSIGAWASYKVWFKRESVSPAVTWATGESGGAGYEAFLLPGTFAIGFIGLALGSAQVWDTSKASEALIPTVFFVAALLAMAAGFWLWLFMWPKFAVPPHLRGEAGWVLAAWRSRGSKGPRREGTRKRT